MGISAVYSVSSLNASGSSQVQSLEQQLKKITGEISVEEASSDSADIKKAKIGALEMQAQQIEAQIQQLENEAKSLGTEQAATQKTSGISQFSGIGSPTSTGSSHVDTYM